MNVVKSNSRMVIKKAEKYIFWVLTIALVCAGSYFYKKAKELNDLNELLRVEVSKKLRDVKLIDGKYRVAPNGFYYSTSSAEVGLNVKTCGKPLGYVIMLVEDGKLSELDANLQLKRMISKNEAVSCLSRYLRQSSVNTVNDWIKAYDMEHDDEKKYSEKIENSWNN